MEDHLAVLNEQVAAGLVPLPELPQHKQVGINVPFTEDSRSACADLPAAHQSALSSKSAERCCCVPYC
jgi:hypothetical protein